MRSHFCPGGGGENGFLNPFASKAGRGDETELVRAAIESIEAIGALRGRSARVAGAVIHIVPTRRFLGMTSSPKAIDVHV